MACVIRMLGMAGMRMVAGHRFSAMHLRHAMPGMFWHLVHAMPRVFEHIMPGVFHGGTVSIMMSIVLRHLPFIGRHWMFMLMI